MILTYNLNEKSAVPQQYGHIPYDVIYLLGGLAIVPYFYFFFRNVGVDT